MKERKRNRPAISHLKQNTHHVTYSLTPMLKFYYIKSFISIFLTYICIYYWNSPYFIVLFLTLIDSSHLLISNILDKECFIPIFLNSFLKNIFFIFSNIRKLLSIEQSYSNYFYIIKSLINKTIKTSRNVLFYIYFITLLNCKPISSFFIIFYHFNFPFGC